MSGSTTLTLGRSMMVFSQLVYSAGAFIADWNETHIHNPTWPGHARFHNGQTMTLGVLLAATSIYHTFRSSNPASSSSPVAAAQQQKDSLWTAAVVGCLYCLAGLSAILYPGTTWSDPPASGSPQVWLFPSLVLMNWGGYAVATMHLGQTSGGRKKV
ncbi:hypothetical protein AAFC00_002070 [Neodothiora populina]|uniref:Uncharacterized protein n=1 Tax=Neodothiora populina TaxID=2781224 RepID=A0ABR3PG89_9PEZI